MKALLLALAFQCPDGTPPPCATRAAQRAAPSNSVAVLYFDNLSRDSADAYLADGLTEEMIARLGQVRRLIVASRYTVRRYRGLPGEPAAVGRSLGVAHLVTGSIQRAGQRLRVRVELLRAATGIRIWGDEFDRVDADLLAIQDEIARAVATAIAGHLLPAERASIAARPTVNREAYDHFLRGNFLLAQRTERAVSRALVEYREATRLDPAFAAAHARMGLAYALFLVWGWDHASIPRDSMFPWGFAASDRALERDSNSSDAWMARGYLLSNRNVNTFVGVREVFQRAIAIDPRNAEAHHQFGSVLRLMDRDSEAEASFQRALAIEPGRPITLQLLSEIQSAQHRFDDARRSLDTAIAADPGYFYNFVDRARVRSAVGDQAGARADADEAMRLSSGIDSLWAPATLALVMARSGDTAGARARVEGLVRAFARPGYSSQAGWLIAGALVALNDHERALDVISRVQQRGGRLAFYLRQSEFDPLRSDPRFQRIVSESRASGTR